MRKKEIKSPFKAKHLLFAGLFIVAVLLFYVYLLFVKPISADPAVASLWISDAAQNPDSSEVKKVLASNHAVRFSLAGCDNLHKVSDTLYRGAQPTKEGFENLKKLGVKTVINLRDFHEDTDLLKESGLNYVSVPMSAWEVSPKKIVEVLKVMSDPNAAPVFVHCQHGADRTGSMVASYRMVIQGWDRNRAIHEMTHGGFGYHSLWVQLPALLKKLDVDKIKQELNK